MQIKILIEHSFNLLLKIIYEISLFLISLLHQKLTAGWDVRV